MISEADDEELIRQLETELQDRDSAAMREILTEFHSMQKAIVALSENPSEETYMRFQVAIERFLAFAENYISRKKGGNVPSRPQSASSSAVPATQPVPSAPQPPPAGQQPLPAAPQPAPRADTGLERTALGFRLKLLIRELKEMLRVIPHIDRKSLRGFRKEPGKKILQNLAFIRPSLAQQSAPQLFGVERQTDVRKYLQQVQDLLGPDGLQYVSGVGEFGRKVKEIAYVPGQAVVSRVANIRNKIFRLVAAVSVLAGSGYSGYVAKKTYNLMTSPRPPAVVPRADETPKPPETPSRDDSKQAPAPTDNRAPQERDAGEEKVLQLFSEMNASVQGGVLKVTFSDLQGFKVNSEVYVCVGTGDLLDPKEMKPEGNGFVYKLTPAEAGSEEINVGLRVNVGNERWLAPKGIVSGKTIFKKLPINH